jgi:hypothetical protein
MTKLEPLSRQIFLDELVGDEELRDAFLRSPRKTLELADDWALPLSATERWSLLAAHQALCDGLVEQMNA